MRSVSMVLVMTGCLWACGGSSESTTDGSSSPPPARTGDLCAGLVQDRQVRPMARADLPPLRTPVVDPAFGGRVVRITDVSPSEGEGAVIKPMYSTTQAWNADETLLLLWHRGKEHELYDGRTYAFLRGLPLESPSDIEQLYWDPIDPDVLYYPSNYNAQPRFMRFRVSRGGSEVVRDFSGPPTNCAVGWDSLLSTGDDPQDMSWNSERIIGLRCGRRTFLYSIAADQVFGIVDDGSQTAPAASCDGQLAYYEGRVVDRQLKVLRSFSLANAYEHSSLGRGSSGPLYGAVDFDGSPAGTLIVYDLRTGAKKPIISQANGWPYPPGGTHISGLARSGPPGWFAVSVVGDSSGSCLLCQELLLANADTGTVCRVAHHHSWAGEGRWGYWAEPHVVLSPSATRLLFGSDWGNGNAVNTYVVELPAYQKSSR